MTEETNNAGEKLKRFRSPPYPMFDLQRAIERVTEVYSKAGAHSVGVTVLAEAWGMKSADGKVWRTAATLIQYGLMADSGSGKARKFQISDSAKRIILDTDSGSIKRKEAIRSAGMGPMIHRELWDKYGAAFGLSDTVIKTHLTIDREETGEAPYSPSAADEVIAVYRSTISYAGFTDNDKVDLADENKVIKSIDGVFATAKAAVGDWVRWISSGVVQFDARKVDWVSDDGLHLKVFGSPTGIPMDQIELVKPPMADSGAAAFVKTEAQAKDEAKSGKLNATAYVENGRLKLTADVGLDELEPLREMLEGYKMILKFLN